MITNVLSEFYKKQPSSIDEMLPTNRKPILCTFLNPYTAYIASKDYHIYKHFDKIASDGILIVLINNLLKKKKTERISFDMTSLAAVLFKYIEENNESIYFLGTTQDALERTIPIIKKAYPSLKIKGYHHGYIQDCEEDIASEIIEKDPDVVIIGMGALKQDQFAVKLKEMGCKSSIYTCGGFLHQTQNTINYYPPWINKFHLRFFYRLFKEPYVWKRLICYYPPFIFSYIKFLLNNNNKCIND